MQRVQAHQLGQLEVVDQPVGLLQRLVELLPGAGHLDPAPELLPQGRDPLQRAAQPGLVAGHPALVPEQFAELAVEGVGRAVAVHREDEVQPVRDLGLDRGDLLVVGRDGGQRFPGQVVVEHRRQHEVAVREALHQRARAEPVGAVVGEVGLADREQARHGGLQVVVDPEPAHRVVDRRVDPHRHPVRVLGGDPLVHLEQVAVLGLHRVPAQPSDGVGEVQVDALPAGSDAAALVADVLGGPGGDVARHQVAEGRVDPLQVVVALLLRDVGRRPGVALGLRHPDPPVVAQRLAHQRQLGLVVAGARDAGRVDLGEARVGEVGAAPVRPPDRGGVGVLGVGGEVEDVAVAAGGEHHGVGGVTGDLAGDQVAGDDPARPAVDHQQVEHLGAGVQLHVPGRDLPGQRLVGAEQQLLAGLAARVEGPGDLDAAERAGVQQAAVLPGERHALGHALVDDLHRHLGEAVHIGLAGAEVAALDGVVEQPADGVAVVAVVLGGVDAALGGDRVGPPGRVLEAELDHVVALFGEGGTGRAARQAGADHDHGVLAPVRRVDQLGLEPPLVPALFDRPPGGPGVGDRLADAVVRVLGVFRVHGVFRGGLPLRGGVVLGGGVLLRGRVHFTTPVITATGTDRKPAVSSSASPLAVSFSTRSRRALLAPRVCAALQNPCRTCRPTASIATM